MADISLPHELMDTIMDYLIDDRHSLATLLMVSLAFNALAKRYVFRFLKLSTPRTFDAFVDISHGSPDIPSMVHHLQLTKIRRRNTVNGTSTIDVLTNLPTLRSLELKCMLLERLPSEIMHIIQALPITTLHLNDMWFASHTQYFNLLACFPSLLHLTVSKVFVARTLTDINNSSLSTARVSLPHVTGRSSLETLDIRFFHFPDTYLRAYNEGFISLHNLKRLVIVESPYPGFAEPLREAVESSLEEIQLVYINPPQSQSEWGPILSWGQVPLITMVISTGHWGFQFNIEYLARICLRLLRDTVTERPSRCLRQIHIVVKVSLTSKWLAHNTSTRSEEIAAWKLLDGASSALGVQVVVTISNAGRKLTREQLARPDPQSPVAWYMIGLRSLLSELDANDALILRSQYCDDYWAAPDFP